MHFVTVDHCPTNMIDILNLAVAADRRPGFGSSSSATYLKPRLKTAFSERFFKNIPALNFETPYPEKLICARLNLDACLQKASPDTFI